MRDKRKHESGFLFSTPSFLIGAGSVLNLAGNYYRYNLSESDYAADCRAIKNDFAMIGQDINDAMLNIGNGEKREITHGRTRTNRRK